MMCLITDEASVMPKKVLQ